jgi:hypothetical protein
VSGHVADRLSAYLDDALDGIERSRVEKHLGSCPECARHLEELLAVDEATRRLELVEPPEGYFEALPGRLRERARAEAPAPKRFVVPAWTWAAAAAVLVAVVAPLVLAPPSLRTPDATAPAFEPGVTAPAGEESPGGARPEPLATAERGAEPAATDEAAEQRVAGERDENLARPTPAPAGASLAMRGEAPAAPPGPAAVPVPQQGFAPAAGEVMRAKAEAPVELSEGVPGGVSEGVPGGVVGGIVGGLPDASPPARRAGEPVLKAAGAEDKATRAAVARQVADREIKKRGAEPPASETAAFEALVTRTAGTAEDARALREAWRAFVTKHPAGPRVDEARVRVIETGLVAFRLGADPADRETALADANAYLARPEAAQVERVRQALSALAR